MILFSFVNDRESPLPEYRIAWRRLQQAGLNAYESRSYVVLLGHPRFKALELAARAHVPRQKIYEVLDSLIEKGFAQVMQQKTKLFSAVDPNLALPAFFERRSRVLENELGEQQRLAMTLLPELRASYEQGQNGHGALHFLSLVNDPVQTGAHYRRMLAGATRDYAEFSRPPFAVDPLAERLVTEAAARGVFCRLLLETGAGDDLPRTRIEDHRAAGVEIRFIGRLPLKLALFDRRCGLVALLDPVLTKPSWTAVVFEHEGFAEAMSGLFETYWSRAGELENFPVLPR